MNRNNKSSLLKFQMSLQHINLHLNKPVTLLQSSMCSRHSQHSLSHQLIRTSNQTSEHLTRRSILWTLVIHVQKSLIIIVSRTTVSWIRMTLDSISLQDQIWVVRALLFDKLQFVCFQHTLDASYPVQAHRCQSLTQSLQELVQVICSLEVSVHS